MTKPLTRAAFSISASKGAVLLEAPGVVATLDIDAGLSYRTSCLRFAKQRGFSSEGRLIGRYSPAPLYLNRTRTLWTYLDPMVGAAEIC